MNLSAKPASPSWAACVGDNLNGGKEDAACRGRTDDRLWTEDRLCSGRNEWLFLTSLLLLLCLQDSSGVIDNPASPDPHPTQIGINGSLRRLAVVKNSSGGTFYSLGGGRANALPFQLKDVFTGTVTHPVTWERNVSSCRAE